MKTLTLTSLTWNSCSLCYGELHEHAKASLEVNLAKRKEYYDKKRRVRFSIGDLIRVRNHPKSVTLANLRAKLAPLYSGPYCVTQVLSDLNYRLKKIDTGEDAGVFHVVDMQPFRTRSKSRVGCMGQMGLELEGRVFPSRCLEPYL